MVFTAVINDYRRTVRFACWFCLLVNRGDVNLTSELARVCRWIPDAVAVASSANNARSLQREAK